MELCAEVKNLTVSFNGETVLDHITTDFTKSGITVLLGRSGSGKTTLLRALNRLNETFPGCSASGSVRIAVGGHMTDIYGENAPDTAQIRRSAGMVFQTPNPLPLSLRKNMTLPMELVLGVRGADAESRMKEFLCRVGLWEEVKERLNMPASSLSGGQQQRLCLARSLALEPDLLLLDEPTASLDKRSSEVIEALLQSLEERIPMIMVSHSLVQAKKLGDHFKIMSGGRIIKEFGREDLPDGRDAEIFLEEMLL